MIKQLFISINGKSNVYTFDNDKDPLVIRNEMYDFVESRSKVHKMFFRLKKALPDSHQMLKKNIEREIKRLNI